MPASTHMQPRLATHPAPAGRHTGPRGAARGFPWTPQGAEPGPPWSPVTRGCSHLPGDSRRWVLGCSPVACRRRADARRQPLAALGGLVTFPSSPTPPRLP